MHNTARIPLEPSIAKPTITPKSRMMKNANKLSTPTARAHNYGSFKGSSKTAKERVSKRKQQEMITYKGPFAINCTTTREPTAVLSELTRALDVQRIPFTRQHHYHFVCKKGGSKFELELCQMENLDFVYVLRMKRLEGDAGRYRDSCNKLLTAVEL